MTRRTGSADLPLHGGHVPHWLSARMARLGAVVTEAIVRRSISMEVAGVETDLQVPGFTLAFTRLLLPPRRIELLSSGLEGRPSQRRSRFIPGVHLRTSDL
jgi:hypothetical protein